MLEFLSRGADKLRSYLPSERWEFSNPPIRPEVKQEPQTAPVDPNNFDTFATLFAEGASDTPEAQRSMFNVVRNRADAAKKSWQDIVTNRDQFNGYGSDLYKQAMAHLQGTRPLVGPNADTLESIRSMVMRNEPDISGNATQFINPELQMEQVGHMPRWTKVYPKTASYGQTDFYDNPEYRKAPLYGIYR